MVQVIGSWYVTKLRRRLPRLGHSKIQLYVICSLKKKTNYLLLYRNKTDMNEHELEI